MIRFTTIMVCALLLATCQRVSDDSGITLNLAVTPNPPQLGAASVVATLTDTDGQPVRGAHVAFEGMMSHAGMQPVLVQPREVAPGRYEAPLDFGMGGDWFIIVRATLPDGRSFERQVNVGTIKAR